jgi:hypothetical protein
MSSTPKLDLAAAEARATAATPGPWTHELYAERRLPPGARPSGRLRADGFPIASNVDDLDGAFIAAARTDVPALARAVRLLLRLHELERAVFRGSQYHAPPGLDEEARGAIEDASRDLADVRAELAALGLDVDGER